MNSKKYTTLFLDRDGVINHKIEGYVQFPHEFRFIEGSKEAISILTIYFDRIIIITNQQGIGKEIMTEKELEDLHNFMISEINDSGGKIDKVYFCPHLESENCNCRKPKSGMLLKAKEDFPSITFNDSILIGDSDSDIQAASSVEMKSIKVSNCFTLHDWTKDFLSD